MIYFYPKNLRSKPKLGLWNVIDAFIGSILILISFFAYINIHNIIPFICSIIFLILKIQYDETCLYYLIKSFTYFYIFKQRKLLK